MCLIDPDDLFPSLHRKRYGDVFRLDSGPLPSVFLCNYEQIVYTMKQDIFSARPHHLIPGFTQVW